jgi:carbamoyl-phosphate synthase large subunit
VRRVKKLHEGRPHVVDHLINGDIHLVVNTPMGGESHLDDAEIRTTALKLDIPCITTLSGARRRSRASPGCAKGCTPCRCRS